MAVESSTKSLPEGFYIRKAIQSDFQQVLNVSKDAYYGFNDIPILFNIWLQNKKTHLYVLSHMEKVVSLFHTGRIFLRISFEF